MNKNGKKPQAPEKQRKPQAPKKGVKSKYIPTIWVGTFFQTNPQKLRNLMSGFGGVLKQWIKSYTIYCPLVPRGPDDRDEGYRRIKILIKFGKKMSKDQVTKIDDQASWKCVLPENYWYALERIASWSYVPILTKPGRGQYGKTDVYNNRKIKKIFTFGHEVVHTDESYERYKLVFNQELMAKSRRDVHLIVTGEQLDESKITGKTVGTFLKDIRGKVKYIIELPFSAKFKEKPVWFPSIEAEADEVVYELWV